MKWIKRIWNITFWSAAVLALLLFVLSTMGGNSDTLKKAMENFLSESTSSYVEIETLNHVGFYPALVFDFEGLEGRAGEGGEIDVFSVGALRLSMGFWDMTFSKGRLREVEVKDVYLAPGIWGDKIVTINRIALEPAPDLPQGGAMKAEGLVGDKVCAAMMPMILEERGYKFAEERSADFTLGDAKARLLFGIEPQVLEPVTRGDDYCDLVRLLLDTDLDFAHNCALAAPKKPEEKMPEETEDEEILQTGQP